MNRTCVVVADAARARLYTFEELAAPPGNATQQMLERVDLVNPERRRRPSELQSDTRPGLDRAGSGRGYAVDDRRAGYMDDLDRRFAVEIVEQLGALVAEHGSRRVVVAASPRMLGHLRSLSESLIRSGLSFDEVARDLTRLSTPQIQEHLAHLGLLPARDRVASA